MELSDSFEVDHPIEAVWEVLTDVGRIAPCLPGAQLTGAEGDEFHGLVKVKVGPVTSQYKGTASFKELDEPARRAVILASGRDTRGAGNASASITVRLEAGDSGGTKVSVDTDLTVTGKVAQFGRGVLADVSRKLMGQFADNLAEVMAQQAEAAASGETASGETASSASDDTADGGAEAATDAPAPPGAAPGAPAADAAAAAPEEVEAVDLLAVAGGSVMKRLVPVLVAVVVVVVVVVVVLSA